MAAFMDPQAFKEAEKQRLLEEEAAVLEKARIREEAEESGGFPMSKEEAGCEFFISVQAPWKAPRSSV